MKARTLALLTLFATVTFANEAVKLSTARDGNSVEVTGSSTMHDWTMTGSGISGSLVVADTLIGAASAEALMAVPPQAVIDIAVKSIRAEHDKMNKLMADALKADRNPMIRYQLTGATLAKAGSPFVVATTGKLTIAGQSRDVKMQVTGTRQGERLVFTGETPIRMSDYGIKPPTAMLGTIKTGNDVKVSFRWVVEAR